MAKKILVVDDDTDILSGLKMFLESEGFDVNTSKNGSEAEALVKSSTLPDLILLDVILSGKDGREISKKLKQNASTSQVPILLMSAHANMDLSLKECMADAFIEKPFDIDFLIGEVKKYTKN